MNGFWLQPALRFAVVGLSAVAAWLAAGDAVIGWIVASIGLLFLIVVQLVYLNRLQRWLNDPGAGPLPDGWGAWNFVFSMLYRARRREETSRRALTLALERFRRAAQALPDGVVLLDAGRHIEWCNAAAELHFGIDSRRDRGLLFTHISRHPVLAEYLQMDVAAMPVTIRPTQNPSQVLSLQLIPYGAEDRLLLSRDVTAVERAETIRRDFVANVSHELRTPLTVLSGFLEALEEGPAAEPAEARRHVRLMREQADRMARLVSDLLALSRLQSETGVAPNVQVDMPAILQRIEANARTLSSGQHKFQWEIDFNLAVTGTETELESALSNLVENAIRYTPAPGEIGISWRLIDGQAVFEIRDSGIGISPEHIPRLTERFYRVDNGRSRETGGTGLGLAIVKHVLLHHQAKLEIESEPGVGSTFRAVFPNRRVSWVDGAIPHPRPTE